MWHSIPFIIFFSCSFTRLMAVYVCMMPFSSPEKNKTKKCYENKGGIEKKGGNMKGKKT